MSSLLDALTIPLVFLHHWRVQLKPATRAPPALPPASSSRSHSVQARVQAMTVPPTPHSLGATLDRLPPELINEICSFLRCSRDPDDFRLDQGRVLRDRAALASLARTSKKYYQHAIPFLYNSIDLWSTDETRTRPVLLCYSLETNESLRPYVRHLTIEQYPHLHREPELEKHLAKSSKAPDDLSDYALLDAEAIENNSDLWYSIQVHELLFRRTTRLETLCYGVTPEADYHDHMNFITSMHLSALSDDADASPTLLPALRHIQVYERSLSNHGGFGILDMFALPLVTKARCLDLIGPIGPLPYAPFEAPNVLQLRIYANHLDAHSFGEVLAAFPELRTLAYHLGPSPSTDGECTSAADLAMALRPIEHRLIGLDLLVMSHLHTSTTSMDFANFTRLTHLSVEVDTLVDPSRTGPSVIDHGVQPPTTGDAPALALAGTLGAPHFLADTSPTTAQNLSTESPSPTGSTVQPPRWIHKLPATLVSLSLVHVETFFVTELCRLANCAASEFPNLTLLELRAAGAQGQGHVARFDGSDIYGLSRDHPALKPFLADMRVQ